MKLSVLYRDVVSALDAPEDKILFKDVTNAINEAISSLRVEYIQNGQGFEFTETDRVYATVDDIEYPFAKYAELDYNIMRSLPIQWTVKQSMFSKTDKFIQNKPQTWTKGDLAIKGNNLYKCVESVDGVNTFNYTFKPSSIRSWSKNNKFEFVQGDVVYDGSSYYIATEDYVNNENEGIADAGLEPPVVSDPTLTSSNVTATAFTVNFTQATSSEEENSFEKLYWMLIGDAYYEARYVPFDQIHQLKLSGFTRNHFPFTIKENKIYTTVTALPFTITYIPEWEYVEDLDTDLDIPDSFIQPVKQNAIQQLGFKLNIDSSEAGSESME